MHLITQKRLRSAWEKYLDAEKALRKWFTEIRYLRFQNFAELRRRYPSTDQVGRLTVFNIKGNHYRLIVRIEYAFGKVFVQDFLTHADYDKDNWKNDPWY